MKSKMFINFSNLSSVVAMDGTTCNTASYFDSFTIYDYKSLKIYVYGDRRVDTTSTLQTKLADKINDLSLVTSSEFKAKFQDTIRSAGMDSHYQSISLASAASYINPVLTGTVTHTVTNASVTLTGLQLSSGNGYFHAIADLGATAPSYSLIRSKQNTTRHTVPGSNTYYDGNQATLTITGLQQNTTYNVYYYASNEDLSGYGRTTDVQHLQIKTSVTVIKKFSERLGLLSAILAFVLLIFAL